MAGLTFHYDDFVDTFEQLAANSPYNAHYDRPTVLRLVGDAAGFDVLDAGCGPGYYAEALLERGARVTGFDAAPRMIERARARVAGASFTVAALGESLPFDDESFDLAVCPLVIHHVDDRITAYRELGRVLRPGGALVVSTAHPYSDWERLGGSYFDSGPVEEEWGSVGLVRFHRQTIGELVDEIVAGGFLVEKLVEPLPEESMRAIDPEAYEKLRLRPSFVAVRALKR